MVKKILHIEGLAVLIASLYFYYLTNGIWWLFALLLLTPDISMIGYVKGKRFGAVIYNIVHNYILSIGIILAGIILDIQLFIHLGLILSAHVGMDRMLGFGLKYKTHFKDTHLQRL